MLDVPDIFISYASKDRERVRALVETFRTFGWSVWWDRELKPGETWDDVIGKALGAARCVVVVWSEHSVKSDWVKIEAEHARQREALVPVYLEMVPLPAPLDRVHGADLTGWTGEAWHQGLQQTVSAIRAKLAARPVAAGVRGLASASSVRTGGPGAFAGADQVAGALAEARSRVLDAAVSTELPVDRNADLIVMLRREESGGLRAILSVDDSYSMRPEDVRTSESFEIEFPRDEAGNLERVILTLKVHSSSFEIVPPEKRIAISPERDSAIYAFLITPRHEGTLTLNLDLYQDTICLASRILKSRGIAAGMEAASSLKHVVSMTVPVKARGRKAVAADRPLRNLGSNEGIVARPTLEHARSSEKLASNAGLSGSASSPIGIDDSARVRYHDWDGRMVGQDFRPPSVSGPGCSLLLVALAGLAIIALAVGMYLFLR
jgi:hypothetical protein